MTRKVLSTDVLVCGGGPAGVAAAFIFGKNNIQTILIDKKTHDKIGDKVCGDALSPTFSDEILESYGLPKPDPDKKELMELLSDIHLIMGPKASISLGVPAATVDRQRYGQALLKAVEKFDTVEVLDQTRATDVLLEDDYVVGALCRGGDEEIEIRAKITIDASGAFGALRSRIPETLDLKFPRKFGDDEMLVAYREIIRTKEPHQFQDGLFVLYEEELEAVMPGYWWAFSRGEKEVNIGLGYFRYKKDPDKNIRELNDAIRIKHFGNDVEILASQGDQIPARLPLPSLVYNGLLITGDAAALSNPINGEGHGHALLSGIKAAEFAMVALNKGDQSEQILWPYNKWVWLRFGTQFCIGVAMINFVNHYSYKGFEWLLEKEFITPSDISAQVRSDHERYRPPLSRVLKLLLKPRLLWGVSRLLRYNKSLRDHAEKYPDYEGFEAWKEEMDQILESF